TEGQIVTGTVTIAASASDATSPVASVEFVVRGSSAGLDTTAPFAFAWNTTSAADGPATIQIVVTDMAGNSATSAVRNVTVDNVAPSGPITAPAGGATVGSTAVTLTSSVADGGSGVASVGYELRPTGGGAFSQIASGASAPFSATWNATTVSSGS